MQMKTTVTLAMDRDLLSRIDAEAGKLEASRSYTVRRLLDAALDKSKPILENQGTNNGK